MEKRREEKRVSRGYHRLLSSSSENFKVFPNSNCDVPNTGNFMKKSHNFEVTAGGINHIAATACLSN